MANVNKSCPERNGGDRKSVARHRPHRRGRQGSNGGVKHGAGMRKMDLLAREGEKVI